MAKTGGEQSPNALRDLQARVNDLTGRVGQLEGRRMLGLDRGRTENVGAPAEGQVLIQADTETPYYYSNGQWRPFGGEPTWATATQFDIGVAKTSSWYRPRFQYCGTNDPDNFTIGGGSTPGADYLYIAKPGYYVVRGGVVTEGGSTHTWGANYAALEIVASIAGSDSHINSGVDGYSDWTGSDYARGHEQYAAEYSSVAGQVGHRGLWTEYTFNYDPASPNFGDLSYEAPLGLALRVVTDKTGTVNMTAQLHVIRLCGPGYTLQNLSA